MSARHRPPRKTPQEIGLATRYIDLGACLSIVGASTLAAAFYRMALRAEPNNVLARNALKALERKRSSQLCPTHKIQSRTPKH